MLLKTIKKEKGDTQYTKYVFKEWDLIKKTCVIPSNSCMFFLGYFYFGHIFLSNEKFIFLTLILNIQMTKLQFWIQCH